MKKIELSQKHWIIIIVCAVLVVALVVTCLIAANVSDKSRFIYELKADGTYKIVDLKNSYRGGLFAKKSITIPDTYKKKPVTQIDKFDTASIEEVIIPEGITTISQRAFANSSSIKSIKLPSTLKTIGTGAFSSCTGLTKIELPESITTVSRDMFSSCINLSEIKLSSLTTAIENGAFNGCKALQSITLPMSVTNIGEGAFANSGLKTLTLPQGATQISKNLFSGCVGLTSVTLSDATAAIGETAFKGCTALESITLPASITTIGDNAFAESGLKTIALPQGVSKISVGMFSKCESLTSVSLPNSILEIGQGAFSGCKLLASLEIPNSVISVEPDSFDGCADTLIKTHNGGQYVGNSANPYMILLKSADAEATQLTTHDNTRVIANNAFAGNDKLTAVTLNDGMNVIGNRAFYNCKNLETLILANSVSIIGDNAFAGCSKLASVTKNGAPFEMGSISTSLNAFTGTVFFNNIAKANKGLVISNNILYGIDDNTLAESFAKDSVTDYDVYMSLEDKANSKLTKLRIKGEEKKITVYIVTEENSEEKLTVYLSVNAQYKAQ